MNYTHPTETIKLDELEDFCDGLTEAQEELSRELLGRIVSKWSMWTLYVLAEEGGPLRFSRVHERVEGVTQKVLTQTLRQLERDGLITRTLYPQVPPRVEYELTPLGGELLAQLIPVGRWMFGNIGRFEKAREAYDNREA